MEKTQSGLGDEASNACTDWKGQSPHGFPGSRYVQSLVGVLRDMNFNL